MAAKLIEYMRVVRPPLAQVSDSTHETLTRLVVYKREVMLAPVFWGFAR